MSDEYLTVPESIDLERKIDKPPEGNKNTVKYDFTDHGFMEIKYSSNTLYFPCLIPLISFKILLFRQTN